MNLYKVSFKVLPPFFISCEVRLSEPAALLDFSLLFMCIFYYTLVMAPHSCHLSFQLLGQLY
jgi:hypothetical protein